jgi:hypothetical protein
MTVLVTAAASFLISACAASEPAKVLTSTTAPIRSSSVPGPSAGGSDSTSPVAGGVVIGAPPNRPAAVKAASTTAGAAGPGSVLPAAGNPSGTAVIPADARAVDTSHPSRVIGSGTAASCTSAAVIAAVAAGGIITFSCGPAPVTIVMSATAKVVNAVSQVVLDGGSKVTLSGAGVRRILYMDTCDQAQGWTTSHCNDQSNPLLVLQNLTFANGNSTGQTTDGGGGGAVFVRGGRVRVVNSRFIANRCDSTGPDLGGAALRVLDQSGGLPVYIVNSTFGGTASEGGICSNGGALSSIGVSWVILNSVFSNNQAIGEGANPAMAGTPGGGSGGAIYTDGNTYTVTITGSAPSSRATTRTRAVAPSSSSATTARAPCRSTTAS